MSTWSLGLEMFQMNFKQDESYESMLRQTISTEWLIIDTNNNISALAH